MPNTEYGLKSARTDTKVGYFSKEFQRVNFFLEGIGVWVGRTVEDVVFGLEFEGLRSIRGGQKLAGNGQADAGMEVSFYAAAGDLFVGEDYLKPLQGGAVGDFCEADGPGGAAGAHPAANRKRLMKGRVRIKVGNGGAKRGGSLAPGFGQAGMSRHKAKVWGFRQADEAP